MSLFSTMYTKLFTQRTAGDDNMITFRFAAIALIVAGALGLAYGGFSYTQQTHKAEIGPLQMSVDEKKTVNVPVWLGIAAVVGGAALLVIPRKS